MRTALIIGVVLIILGGLALAYQGITYTDREKVIDIGPLEATAERKKTIALPPVVGGAMVASGILLVIFGGRRRA
jgi:uncharacterized membrane protein HdeD (DUF308 family)